ncbi:hypothetical protein IWW52_001244 [Coemansia sp. RSA 2704]|nr:hypothetical protein IWW52_001244 [Coemansia sp. RSA 2704]
MSTSTVTKRVRFAEGSRRLQDPYLTRQSYSGDEADSDINDGLEADLTAGRRRGRQVNVDGYGSDASDQDEIANLSDISDDENPNDEPVKDEDKDGDADMFADDDTADQAKKRKRTLDIDDIEGQDMTSTTRTETDDFDRKGKQSSDGPADEGKNKIEAFNMRDDLEEGTFDASGTFVWNKKDPQAYQDEWLADVSGSAIQQARESKLKREQAQTAQNNDQMLRWDAVSNDDIVVSIINMLQPRETVFAALARIGGAGKGKKKASRWSKKGRKQMDTDGEAERERKQSIERLTELADQAMARGMASVYDDTYEQMVRQMRMVDRIPDNWAPGTLLPTLAHAEPAPNAAADMDSGGLLDDIL